MLYTLSFHRYDWNQQPWYFRNKHCHGHPKSGRVPMVWAWRRPYDVPLKIPHNARYVLGFNEPNFKTQANMTPWQAAQHWRELEKQTHGKKLVSPSASPCTKGGICIMNSPDWFHEFFNVSSNPFLNTCRSGYYDSTDNNKFTFKWLLTVRNFERIS